MTKKTTPAPATPTFQSVYRAAIVFRNTGLDVTGELEDLGISRQLAEAATMVAQLNAERNLLDKKLRRFRAAGVEALRLLPHSGSLTVIEEILKAALEDRRPNGVEIPGYNDPVAKG